MQDSSTRKILSAASETSDLYRLQVRELSDYAMFVIDVNGIIISWNAGVQKLLGYSEDEWIGQHASIMFTPEEQAMEVCRAEMRKAAESGAATDIRWHRTKHGSEFFANGFMYSLRDSSGALLGFAKVMNDETARKELQDSLTESNAALEQFAYVASHDLQEPLRTMSVYAQLVGKRYAGQLDEEADRLLSQIVTSAGQMSGLVQDLLAYARLATEDERPVSVALDEDLEAALTHLNQAVEESSAVVTHDPLPVLAVDRGQMVRLFQNLIGNALKYRHPDRQPRVHISAQQRGSEWVISVQDNGIGFEPRFASDIFAPFKRLHAASDYPGTGVGLAICRRIVTGQGGAIWAESEPGKGSTFAFSLPVERSRSSKHGQARGNPRPEE